MSTNGNAVHGEEYAPSTTTVETPAISSSPKDISKDEVGWYFVEQYYTTLSRHPDKLHLFYSKRSQFVYGQEAEAVNVAVGRQAIQDRIKQLNIDDCKVRVSNVDSQSSYDNIVIQVIGETSMHSQEPKKFVQTFILAQQPSGYFVLNDILRYIDEDGEEEGAEGAVADITSADAAPVEIAGKPEPATAAQESAPLDTNVVDAKLEEVGEHTEDHKVEHSAAAGVTEIDAPAEDIHMTDRQLEQQPAVDPEEASKELAEEELKQPELPQDPTPTPAPKAAVAPPPTEPAKPTGPPKPMTWASRAAAAGGAPRPAVPLPKPAAAAPAAAGAAAAPAQARAPLVNTTNTASRQAEAPPTATANTDSANEWRTAGSDNKRQSRPQSVSGPGIAEKDLTMGYVRNVTEKVKDDELRAALGSAGELIYFDVNRSKNCAFIEYATPAGYQAAIAANPYTVSGEIINVEPRRPKASAYGGSNYSHARGGMAPRGRGGFDGGRGGPQGGRGAFVGTRGRGGMAPRGRGASQATGTA